LAEGAAEAKLIAATTGTKLVGPLEHPYEPWHWTIGAATALAVPILPGLAFTTVTVAGIGR
jgi:hypothetical protein